MRQIDRDLFAMNLHGARRTGRRRRGIRTTQVEARAGKYHFDCSCGRRDLQIRVIAATDALKAGQHRMVI
jgi:hypothetical protein